MAKKNTQENFFSRERTYLWGSTWGRLLFNPIIATLIAALILFICSKVYGHYFPDSQEQTIKEFTEAVVEQNSRQFSAKIYPNISSEKELINDGWIRLKIIIGNTGQIGDFEIPPSKSITGYTGYEEFSELVVRYFDPKNKLLGEPIIIPVAASPILPGDKSENILLDFEIPPGSKTVEIKLSCDYINPNKPCKEPKAEKLIYSLSIPLKILVIDASREKDKIGVPSLRKKIEEVYGNSNFFKSTWSSIPVGRKFIRQPILLYNEDKGYFSDSEQTKQLQKAIDEIYGDFYKTSLSKLNGENWDKFAYILSDCGLDETCETNLFWDNLKITSNRFSPTILYKNEDIDFVIFLPSNI